MSAPSDVELRERYRLRLLAAAEDMRAASGGTTADRRPIELDQQRVKRLSRMDAMQQQAMVAAQEVRHRASLTAIDAAQLRLNQGEFGWCADCGKFIGTERLDLDPTRMRCVGCAR